MRSIADFAATMGWAIQDGVGKHTAFVFVDFGSRSVYMRSLLKLSRESVKILSQFPSFLQCQDFTELLQNSSPVCPHLPGAEVPVRNRAHPRRDSNPCYGSESGLAVFGMVGQNAQRVNKNAAVCGFDSGIDLLSRSLAWTRLSHHSVTAFRTS